ncbi:MAG: hypothetical protein LBS89_04475 [Zoogloeaceae bacterium]|jgi:hypothetical protein|nr:hypothetical protein [Zoogloeaceae bacterium]
MNIGINSTLWRNTNTLRATLREQNTTPGLQQKRLDDIRQALKKLQEAPTLAASNKQAATQKVGILKQRLQLLKHQIKTAVLCGTPEQAKALARELKNIARELAGAARALGGSGAGVGAVNGFDVTVAGDETGEAERAEGAKAASAEEAAEAEQAEAAVEGAQQAQDAEAAAAAANASVQSNEGDNAEAIHRQGDNGDEDDKTLRELLHDARKLLKENINLLKAAVMDKEGRKELQKAEEFLRDLDVALQGGGELYTVVGNWADGSLEGMALDARA